MGTTISTSVVARVLFGQTRRDVLALLLGRPDERFYLREILRAVGGGTGAVQRELKQLVEAGLVQREREGVQVYFSANREAAIFSELQAIIQKTAGVTEVLRASLAPVLRGGHVAVAFVYGSVARGGQTARSDVDLMVVGDVTLGRRSGPWPRGEPVGLSGQGIHRGIETRNPLPETSGGRTEALCGRWRKCVGPIGEIAVSSFPGKRMNSSLPYRV